MLKGIFALVVISSFVFAAGAQKDDIICEEINWSNLDVNRLKESVKIKCGKEICQSVNSNKHPAFVDAYCSCVVLANKNFYYGNSIINFTEPGNYRECSARGAFAERKYKEAH